jgi:hypothetical protein
MVQKRGQANTKVMARRCGDIIGAFNNTSKTLSWPDLTAVQQTIVADVSYQAGNIWLPKNVGYAFFASAIAGNWSSALTNLTKLHIYGEARTTDRKCLLATSLS